MLITVIALAVVATAVAEVALWIISVEVVNYAVRSAPAVLLSGVAKFSKFSNDTLYNFNDWSDDSEFANYNKEIYLNLIYRRKFIILFITQKSLLFIIIFKDNL